MEFNQDLIRGSIIPIVLSLLDERSMYGYEIVKIVNARSNGLLEWKEGTLYPTLHKLEAEGFLCSAWQSASNDRKRKYYSLTGKGRTELKRRLGELVTFNTAVARVLGGAS